SRISPIDFFAKCQKAEAQKKEQEAEAVRSAELARTRAEQDEAKRKVQAEQAAKAERDRVNKDPLTKSRAVERLALVIAEEKELEEKFGINAQMSSRSSRDEQWGDKFLDQQQQALACIEWAKEEMIMGNYSQAITYCGKAADHTNKMRTNGVMHP